MSRLRSALTEQPGDTERLSPMDRSKVEAEQDTGSQPAGKVRAESSNLSCASQRLIER